MKATLILGSLLILTNLPAAHGQQLKFGDPNYKLVSDLTNDIGWYQITATKAWTVKDGATSGVKDARCMITLNKLRDAGVPDSTIANVRYDTPEFRRGPHTLAEIRASCVHLETLGKIKYFERWAKFAMEETPNLSKGQYNVSYFKNCLQAYDEIVQSGVSPSQRVPDDVIKGAPWSGSIEELRRKWCDAGFHTANAKIAEGEAPYRKVLQNDKLKVALTYQEVILPGGTRTTDPQKMAAASVWFEDFSPSKVCNDGRQIHNLRRYQFASDQRILKTTEQEYCGGAPSSAYR